MLLLWPATEGQNAEHDSGFFVINGIDYNQFVDKNTQGNREACDGALHALV